MLAIDLFCGLGGWAEGLLAEGWDVVGFDIERHAYGTHRYPAQLVLQDVLTLHGSQFREAALIVATSAVPGVFVDGDAVVAGEGSGGGDSGGRDGRDAGGAEPAVRGVLSDTGSGEHRGGPADTARRRERARGSAVGGAGAVELR